MTDVPARFIVVVGMGPVGMTVALSLARQGIPVTVLEAGADLATESRASTFHAPSLEIMRDLGVFDELAQLGFKAPGFQYRGHDRELIADLDMSVLADDTDFPFRLQCEQHKLTRIIRGHLESMPHVTLRFGAAVERVEVGVDKVYVYLPGDRFEPSYTADWLLGADGANSVVRRSLGIAFEGVTYPERFLVVSTTHDFAEDMPDLAPVSYVYDPDDWGVLLRVPAHWRALFPIAPETSNEQALDPDYIQNRLQTVVALDEPYPVVHSTIYSVHQRLAATFARGRALLMGDAAHINNPLGGMGMNSGLHDAHAAVQALTYAMNGGDPERATETYARVRRDAAMRDVQQNTQKNYEEMRQHDDRLRSARHTEMVEIAADSKRARAYLRVASMLASFETSSRRLRRGLTPVRGAQPAPAGQQFSDLLRDWGLPGVPTDPPPTAVVLPAEGGAEAMEKEVASTAGMPAVAAGSYSESIPELVHRAEQAGFAAVEVSNAGAVAEAVATRRDLLVLGCVETTGRSVQEQVGEAVVLAGAGADIVALIGARDLDSVAAMRRAVPGVTLALTLTPDQRPDLLDLTLAGVGLLLDRSATS